MQRVDPGARDPGELSNFVRMSDTLVEEYIVRDIVGDNSGWRWALAHPELRVRTKTARGLKLAMDFAVPPVTFRVTGPVRITCFVDGKSLGAMEVPKPGQYRYERPVPDGWVRAGVPVTITAETDKLFVAKDDGAQLGFLLGGAGLIE